MIELRSTSPGETEAFAERLARELRAGDVITLHGPLGAGKTCFVRGLARGLGLDARRVSSPTFVICQEYAATEAGALTLLHLDAYRLSDPNEVDGFGFDEMLTRPDVVVAIEWPERLGDRCPTPTVRVELDHVDLETRALRVSRRE